MGYPPVKHFSIKPAIGLSSIDIECTVIFGDKDRSVRRSVVVTCNDDEFQDGLRELADIIGQWSCEEAGNG